MRINSHTNYMRTTTQRRQPDSLLRFLSTDIRHGVTASRQAVTNAFCNLEHPAPTACVAINHITHLPAFYISWRSPHWHAAKIALLTSGSPAGVKTSTSRAANTVNGVNDSFDNNIYTAETITSFLTDLSCNNISMRYCRCNVVINCSMFHVEQCRRKHTADTAHQQIRLSFNL